MIRSMVLGLLRPHADDKYPHGSGFGFVITDALYYGATHLGFIYNALNRLDYRCRYRNRTR